MSHCSFQAFLLLKMVVVKCIVYFFILYLAEPIMVCCTEKGRVLHALLIRILFVLYQNSFCVVVSFIVSNKL